MACSRPCGSLSSAQHAVLIGAMIRVHCIWLGSRGRITNGYWIKLFSNQPGAMDAGNKNIIVPIRRNHCAAGGDYAADRFWSATGEIDAANDGRSG